MKRLVESGTPFERDLLESLKLERPSPELEQRMRDALGLGPVPAPAPLAPDVPAASAAKATFGGWGAVAVGTVAAAVLVGGAVLLGRTPAEDVRPPSVAPPEPPVEPQRVAPPPEEPREPAPEIAPEQPKSAPRTAPPERPSPKTVASPSLREEIALIDEARVAVREGNIVLAHRLLDRYARRFPNGTFAAEARILRERAGEPR